MVPGMMRDILIIIVDIIFIICIYFEFICVRDCIFQMHIYEDDGAESES